MPPSLLLFPRHHDFQMFWGAGRCTSGPGLSQSMAPAWLGRRGNGPAYPPGPGSPVFAWLSLPSTASAPLFPLGSPAPSLSLPPGVANAQLHVAPRLIASESWRRKANESVCDYGLGRWARVPVPSPEPGRLCELALRLLHACGPCTFPQRASAGSTASRICLPHSAL